MVFTIALSFVTLPHCDVVVLISPNIIINIYLYTIYTDNFCNKKYENPYFNYTFHSCVLSHPAFVTQVKQAEKKIILSGIFSVAWVACEVR